MPSPDGRTTHLGLGIHHQVPEAGGDLRPGGHTVSLSTEAQIRMGRVGRSTLPFTLSGVTSAALILLTVSGCSLIDSTDLISQEVPSVEASDRRSAAEPFINGPDEPQKTTNDAFDREDPVARLLNPRFHSQGTGDSPSGAGAGAHSLTPNPDTTQELLRTPVADVQVEPAAEEISGTSSADDRSDARTANLNISPATSQLTWPSAEPRVSTPASAAQPDTASDHQVDTPRAPAAADGTSHVLGSGPPASDPSMLDRLRELYAPDPDRRRSGDFRRRIRGLTPWNILGNREDSAESSQAAGHSPLTDLPVAYASTAEPEASPLAAAIEETKARLAIWPRGRGGAPERPLEFRQQQVNLRLLQLVADQPAAAISAVEYIAAEEQEFLQDLILGIARFRSPNEKLDGRQQAAQTVGQIRSAVQHLKPLSALRIRRLDLCSRIHSFGSIDTFPANEFDPGDRVLIYVEVDNLHSELLPGQNYRTVLSGRLQIFPESSDEAVEEPLQLPAVEDESGSQRTDYYQSYAIALPSHLLSGTYRLQLQIQDDLTGRRATDTLHFVIR